ncbi:hypothetical protein CH63R_07877 [Colletotrichum higginsianum IMI 349063]|uniref:Uncharacterized protein n=3 Tax=Colletotrichum higginsianum TaxID=80884 RepID=A0A1B7YAL0_COLHI|nr:hypothetical protein CH63R_07877 [Colletotrichum higginsianum IMI 349063]OBR09112.1 hypothetical protein CH63R_07877 [Colletotrichum higginsianum IMI 349063]
MESSHLHFGMFPPAFPTTPATYYPQPITPAKREDDDVQFVSSNPVKRRRIDGHQTTPPSITNSPHTRQLAPSSHKPLEPAKLIAQPERRGSTGTVDPTAATHMPDMDPARGCSVPTPERSGYQESFWTAPCTGPQSSPPVSPKSFPDQVSSSMLRTDKSDEPAAHGHLGGNHAAAAGWPGPAQPIATPSQGPRPSATRDQGTPSQVQPENQKHTETSKDMASMTYASPVPAGVAKPERTASTVNVVPIVNAMITPWQHTAEVPVSDHSCTGTETEHAAFAPSFQQHTKSSCSKATVAQFHPYVGHSTPSSSPLTLAAHVGSHGATDTQAGTCSGRPASGTAKGPCRQCMEARMRQQAANMAAAASILPSVPKAPTSSQASVQPSTIQQPWAHLLGLNPYHNVMAGAMYGPLLQQPLVNGPNGPFTIPSQQSHLPTGLPPHQSAGNMFHFGSASPMSQTQAYVTQQPPVKAIKAAPASSKPQTSRIPDTQLTTKHIVVDIADTCLDIFPFAEVAKRHNQPEQKVRDIFAAVIQVPLLRCPTDKRRAGKLGTARVKEFNQAKKEMQAQQGNTGQARQESPNQMTYPSSAWDVAQFMGASDVRLGGFTQYSGPWS